MGLEAADLVLFSVNAVCYQPGVRFKPIRQTGITGYSTSPIVEPARNCFVAPGFAKRAILARQAWSINRAFHASQVLRMTNKAGPRNTAQAFAHRARACNTSVTWA